jgi:toxin HigB-1
MALKFSCRETERIWTGVRSKRLPGDIQSTALRQPRQHSAAQSLDDLRVPPGNRLEALSGDRRGQHAIRINDQRRICFVWSGTGARDVEIVDDH